MTRSAWIAFALSWAAMLLQGCSSSDSSGIGGSMPSAGSGAVPSGGGPDLSSLGGAQSNAGASSVGGAQPSAGGSASGGDSEPANETGMTAAHNAARAAVMPAADPAIGPLAWSSTVAASAQAWADGCNFKHSGNAYGENLYASAGQNAAPQAVVDSWVSEVKDYDYATNTCSGTCGHYTQVVWRSSTKLGCGVAQCSKNSPFSGFANWQIWVCEYDPPGNFDGQKPY